jgi:hypothetical protein
MMETVAELVEAGATAKRARSIDQLGRAELEIRERVVERILKRRANHYTGAVGSQSAGA